MAGSSLKRKPGILRALPSLFNDVKLRLQYKLGLTFFFSFILPVFIFGIFLIFSFRHILERNLFSYQEISINQLQSELDKYFIDLHRVSRTLSYDIPFTIELGKGKDDSARRDHREYIHGYLARLVEGEPSILGYLLLTDRAAMYTSPGLEDVAEPESVLPEGMIEDVLGGKKVIALGKARNDYLLGFEHQDILLFASQINITYLEKMSINKGLLLLLLDREYIDSIIARHSRPMGDIFLFSSDGDHIYSSNREIGYRKLPGELVDLLQREKHGRYTLRESSLTHLVSFTTSRFNTIKLLAFSTDRLIRNDIFFLSKFTIIFLLVLLAIFFTFTVYLSHSISSPVNRLERILGTLEQSSFSDTAELETYDNRGMLSPYFNHLYQFLGTTIRRINHFHRREKEHELMILQAQINPHFVYNSLNTIRLIAEMEKQDRLAEATRSLIHLLKNSIRIGVIFISIREEIDQIRDYISLQLLRYSDSFRVEFDLDERVYEYKCIKFILQPLVENAIYHGIDINSRKGVISIRVEKKGPHIEYAIEDNGKGIAQHTLDEINRDRDIETKTDGIGLQNVRLRLKTYFGENASLHIESEPGKGTRVFYSIPAERYE